jgi:SAM-dependent methyltransferase
LNVLHLGCGRKQWDADKLFPYVGLAMSPDGVTVTHLDADAALNPDLVCALGETPIPLPDNSIDLVVAWHVLEHIGRQGETAAWFQFWEDTYRVLKPNGWLYGESPYYSGIWAWSDPTHSRAISEHSFVFFNQDNYRLESSAISPYRIRADFQWLSLAGLDQGHTLITAATDARNTVLRFALAAKKPFTGWWEN